MILYINFLAWMQNNINFPCFANVTMSLIFNQEMPPRFTSTICLRHNISTLENRGDTSFNQNIVTDSHANFREIWRRTLCLGLILLLLYSFEISATNGRLKSTTILHNDISHLRHETLSMFIIRKNYVELTQAENRVR